MASKTVTCELIGKATLQDTTIAVLPNLCNSITFDKKQSGIWKVFSGDTVIYGIYTVKKGLLDGLSLDYYPNGQLKSFASYRDGKLHGVYKSFHSSGKPYYDGRYDKKGFSGLSFEFYWDNGKIAKQTKLKNNSARATNDEKCWDNNGREIDVDEFYRLYFDCD